MFYTFSLFSIYKMFISNVSYLMSNLTVPSESMNNILLVYTDRDHAVEVVRRLSDLPLNKITLFKKSTVDTFEGELILYSFRSISRRV